MTTDEALKMLEKTGKIETLGTVNPGQIIDLYNQLLNQKREKYFRKDVESMNDYYFPLLLDTVMQRDKGVENPIYKSNKILIP